MFLLHSLIILLIYASPFLVDWKIILVFIVLYYIQLLIFGNCILTLWQFKERTRDTTFYSYLLNKLGFYPDKRRVRIVVDYLLPWLILAMGLAWQAGLGHVVWLRV